MCFKVVVQSCVPVIRTPILQGSGVCCSCSAVGLRCAKSLMFGPFLNPFHMLQVNPSMVHECVKRCILGDKASGTGYCCNNVVKLIKR